MSVKKLRKYKNPLTPKQRSENARKAAFAMLASLTSEQKALRNERIRKIQSKLTPEQRIENGRKANASLTPDQRRERGRKLANSNQALTPERRREIARRAGLASIAAMTPEQRMARGEQLNALFTHEQRSENGRKGREAAEVKINGLENIL